ncbi:uncharacterized protein M6B38_114460 [Iris pallida]|uniref:Uncharacterized protein n=1 Tax=Iris pallida TaxID=29817 RepID=A0AAX6IBU5_IRIPA|nr:uncharacterized protein M6B38_114460 [Iris pallida]
MFEQYCEKAQLKDGQTILDIGCGWGSLSLYIVRKYANCSITGICNSTTQKAYIEERCSDFQLSNVKIIVADISKFEMEATYDRIISVEMFEHMKNYKELLKKISTWMKQDGLLFVHHFCHKVLLTILRTQVLKVGLRETSSVEEQCLLQTFFSISRRCSSSQPLACERDALCTDMVCFTSAY